MGTVRQLIRYLEKEYEPEDLIAYDYYTAEEVESWASILKVKMTAEQVDEVIDRLDNETGFGLDTQLLKDTIIDVTEEGT